MRLGAAATIDNATLQVEKITSDGERIVVLDQDVDPYAKGSMPLPPYIGRENDLEDATRYQTVFAQAPRALAEHCRASHACRAIFHFGRRRNENEQCQANRSCWHDSGARAGIGRGRERKTHRANGLHRHFHFSSISVSSRRFIADEFPSAALDFADARERICRPRVSASGLPGSDSRTLSILQLWRLHVDFVIANHE